MGREGQFGPWHSVVSVSKKINTDKYTLLYKVKKKELANPTLITLYNRIVCILGIWYGSVVVENVRTVRTTYTILLKST